VKLRCGKLFAATFVFSIFANLLKLTGPLFMLQVYDRVLGSRSVETLIALFILVAALFFLYGLLEYARGRVIARIGARFQTGLQMRVFDAVLRASARRKKTRGGDNALQDLAAIGGLFASPVLLTLFDVFWTPVFLLTIFIFHPMLGWLAVAGGSALVLAAIANQLLTRRNVFSDPAQCVAQPPTFQPSLPNRQPGGPGQPVGTGPGHGCEYGAAVARIAGNIAYFVYRCR